MKMRKLITASALMFSAAVMYASPAAAVEVSVTLPPPPGFVDGIQTAVMYDDFWSYSNQILRTIQKAQPQYLPVSTYGNFGFATGTGGLDVILYTGAAGADNLGTGPGGTFNFENPTHTPAGGANFVSGWWGQNDQNNDGTPDNVNGPVTVGQVLDYLHAFNPLNSIPVFYMDMNQIGKEASLFFGGEVYLVDTNGNRVHTWALDRTPQAGDGNYDPDAPALAAGEIGPLIGASGYDYGTVNHNLGSGKADFIAYAPTMDLSLFDRDLIFVTHFDMANLTDGYEEIFLTGAIAVTPPPPPVPEPATVVLLGAGLLGLGLYGRRKARK